MGTDFRICVADNWGDDPPGEPITYAAYWSPLTKLTFFTGNWLQVPPMRSQRQPTADQCYEWVKGYVIPKETYS